MTIALRERETHQHGYSKSMTIALRDKDFIYYNGARR